MEWVAPSNQDQHLLTLARQKTPRQSDASVLPALAGTLARALGCETVVVRLRDSSHQWTSAQHGATGLGCLLEQSIALTAADHSGALIASDAASHPLLQDHPLVASDAKVRSFAGIAAFVEADDCGLEEAVGVICALSDKPREFDPHTAAVLENMSVLMTSLYAQRIELHRQEQNRVALEQDAEAARRLQRQFRQAERMAAIGSWRISIDGRDLSWSEGVYAIHELPVGSNVPLADAINFYTPADRETVLSSIERAIETGESYDFEADFVSAKGTVKRVRVAGEMELANGRPAALVGVLQDITEKHKLLKELGHRVATDPLTGPANRARFDEDLASRVRAAVASNSPLGVVLIDLDAPWAVDDNDTEAELQRRASAILRSSWLKDSFVTRLDGGELVLLLQDERHIDDLSSVLDQLVTELSAPLDQNGKSIPIGVSLGASILHPDSTCSEIELLHHADRALNAAKRDTSASVRIVKTVCSADCAADNQPSPI
tara:strand:+ start:22125 stop:23600 length:1476 start_codon:yes stop_codon:yes gene_type:complete